MSCCFRGKRSPTAIGSATEAAHCGRHRLAEQSAEVRLPGYPLMGEPDDEPCTEVAHSLLLHLLFMGTPNALSALTLRPQAS